MEYLIFNCDYFDIPTQDRPDPGHLVVCHYWKRFGKMWMVALQLDEEEDPPRKRLGLFFNQEFAEFFADAYCRKNC